MVCWVIHLFVCNISSSSVQTNGNWGQRRLCGCGQSAEREREREAAIYSCTDSSSLLQASQRLPNSGSDTDVFRRDFFFPLGLCSYFSPCECLFCAASVYISWSPQTALVTRRMRPVCSVYPPLSPSPKQDHVKVMSSIFSSNSSEISDNNNRSINSSSCCLIV